MRRHIFLILLLVFFLVPVKVLANTCSDSGNFCTDCDPGLLSGGQSIAVGPMQKSINVTMGWCNQCIGYDPGTERYQYDKQTSSKPGGLCQSAVSTSPINSSVPLNTNVNDTWWHGAIPNGCDQDFTCEAGGQQGQCEQNGSGAQCPGGYQGDNCSAIPCGWREECGCTCACDSQCEIRGGQCQDAGAGGPTATPTPTPTPYCTLSCPSAGSTGGGTGDTGVGGSGTGTGGSGGSSNSLRASGNLSYNGYYGFLCDVFADGWVSNLICPSSGSGGQGGLGSGGSQSWDQPVTYNMLCGEQETTYTASVDGVTSSGQAGAGGAGGRAPTAGPTPTPGLYPPGCSIGGGPTASPTPGGSHGGSGGGVGSGAGGALSCSCTATLSCPLALQTPPSDPANESGNCTPSLCDFTVNPSFPIFSTEVTFSTDVSNAFSENSLNFEDNSATSSVSSGTSDTVHTFVNAGSYNVTLSCGNGSGTVTSCSRIVNAYCNNGIAPSPSPTPAATSSWFKVKDTSFHRELAINNTIPANATSYDSSDTGICSLTDSSIRACMLSGDAGTAVSEGGVSVGSGITSAVGWQKADTTIIKRLSPSTFLGYSKSRKFLTQITAISDISGKKVYLHSGNLTISNADFAGISDDFVLIVQGNLTITDSLTNLDDQSVAFISTGSMNIEEAVSQLHGIYVATSVDFASDTTQTATPLKIVGNIIAKDPADLTKRVRSDESKPSLFVTLDMQPYLDLLPLLSIRNTEQQELAQ